MKNDNNFRNVINSSLFTHHRRNKTITIFKSLFIVLLAISLLPLNAIPVSANQAAEVNDYSPQQDLSDSIWKANIWRGGAGPYDVRKITENGKVVGYYAVDSGTTNRVSDATLEWLLVFDAASRDNFTSLALPSTTYQVVPGAEYTITTPFHINQWILFPAYDTKLPTYIVDNEDPSVFNPMPDMITHGEIIGVNNGIAFNEVRADIYRDVILQAVLQPLLMSEDSSDFYSEYLSEMRLTYIREFIKGSVEKLGQAKVDELLSLDMQDLMQSIQDFDGKNTKHVTAEEVSRFFDFLDLGQESLQLNVPGLGIASGAFGLVQWEHDVNSGALMAIIDRALMMGLAEDRIIVLDGYINSFQAGSIDQAVVNGMDIAWNSFYEILDKEEDIYLQVANQPENLVKSALVVGTLSLGTISAISAVVTVWTGVKVALIPHPVTIIAGVTLSAIGVVMSYKESGISKHANSWREAILANELSKFLADNLGTSAPSPQAQVSVLHLFNLSWYLKAMYYDFLYRDSNSYTTSNWPYDEGTNSPSKYDVVNEAEQGRNTSLNYARKSLHGLWLSSEDRYEFSAKILPFASETGLNDFEISSWDGFFNTQFNFRIKFFNPNRKNIAPERVELVIDDADITTLYPEGGDPISGQTFGAALSGFSLGTHEFYIRAELDGKTYTYPQTGGVKTFEIIANSTPPQLEILSPNNDFAFRYFNVEWQDYDPDDEAVITLGYDTNNSGCDGVIIQNWISEEWTTNWWTWRDMPSTGGPFWVYGIINDGHNPPVCSYSPGTVFIESPTYDSSGYTFDHFEIDDSEYGDGDGVWDSGEQIDLAVYITNDTNVHLNDVYAVIYTREPKIAYIDDDANFWASDPGITRGGKFELIADDNKSGSIGFEIVVYYRENGGDLKLDSEYFNVVISQPGSEPSFSITNITYNDNDLTEADADGIPESGEDSIHTTISMANIGGATASNVEAVLSQPAVGRWANPEVDYPDITPGQSAGPLDSYLRLDDIPVDFSGNLTQTLTVYYGVDHQFSKTINFTVTIQPTPRIKLLETNYDFGVVSPGTQVTHDFQVTNIGTQIATISGVTTSHPDLTFSNVPTSIQPGQTAIFHAVFNTTGLDSSVTRTFTINSNAHLLSTKTGTIVGTVHDIQAISVQSIFSDTPTSSSNAVDGGDSDGDGLIEIFVLDLYLAPVTADNYTVLIVYEQVNSSSDDYVEVYRSSNTAMPGTNYNNTLAAVDINSDGKTELIIATGGTNAPGVYYVYSTGNNSFSINKVFTPSGTYAMEISVGDTDGDGQKDLIIGKNDYTIDIVEYGGGTTFTKRWTSPALMYSSTQVRACASTSGDSDLDGSSEAIIGTEYGQVQIFESTGNNAYNSTSLKTDRLESGLGGSYSLCDIAVSDLDVDGKPDILYINDDVNKMFVLESSGNNTWPTIWAQTISPNSSDDPQALALGDINANGKPDAAIGYNGSPDGFTIYESFAANSFAPIFLTTDSVLVESDFNELVVKNVNGDALPEILAAHSMGISVLSLTKDLILSNISAEPSPVTEGNQSVVTASIANNSGLILTNINVSFYNGDPDSGGSLLGNSTITSVAGGASASTTLNTSFPTASVYTIFAKVDPANAVKEGNESNNKKSIPLTVIDNDQDPPAISNVVIAESGGDGDGLFEENEQLKITWTTTDPSGISSTEVNTECSKGSVTNPADGNYQLLIGPCSVGSYTFIITSTDNDNSPISRTTTNNPFDVYNHQPVISNTNPTIGAENVTRNSNTLIWFGTAMNASSINTTSIILETMDGQPVFGTVNYDPAIRRATFTPNGKLAATTIYQVIIHGGVNGIKDSNNNALDVNYTWQFTTISNQAPIAPFSPSPANNATNLSISSNLTWSANDPDNDSLTFTVYFGTNSNPTTVVCSNTQNYACDPGTLAEDTLYYWKVTASDGALTATSPIWSFRSHKRVPEITMDVQDGDVTPDPADGTDFGTAQVTGEILEHTFTVSNTGDFGLQINASPSVVISGTNASDFTVTAWPDATVVPGGITTFTVAFDPSAAGIRTAIISIANDDSDENPYNFAIQGTGTEGPEISLRGNNVIINDGDTTPSISDHTDFGNLNITSETLARSFTIQNNGTQPLTLNGSPRVAISGANAADFTVVQPTVGSISPGGTATFTITFNPSALGLRTASVSITNNDSNENPYDFTIQGTGTLPEIDVRWNEASIVDGDITPTLAEGTDFGNVNTSDGPVVRSFTIYNTGNAALALPNSPSVIIEGTHASDYSISDYPDASIPAGGSSTFTVVFSPKANGQRSAAIRIPNNDSDENPYNFYIQGFGTLPPVASGTYDERNANVVYSGTWVAQTIAGNYANTEKYSTVIGSTAGFTFTGNQATVRFRKASVFGNMEVWIDGGLVATVSQKNATTLQNQIWISPVLSAGTHTILLKHATGTYIALDAIIISGPPTATPTASLTFTPSKTNTLTNTPTPTSTKAPSGVGTYDERDANIVYTGTWVAQAVTGNYANTEKYSKVIGSTAGFTFTGNQATIRFRKASVFGNMEVWIDGGLVDTVSQKNATTLQNQSWVSPVLSAGTHTIVLKHTTGTYIALDAIIISGPPTATPTASLTFTPSMTNSLTNTPSLTHTRTLTFTPTLTNTKAPSGVGTYDERNANIVYTGTWVAQTISGNYANTEKYSTVIGSTAGFTFTGNQATVRFRKASVFGNMEVWIDGVLVDTVNQKNAATLQNQTWVSPVLPDGTHTIVLKHATGTYISLDAIIISGPPTATPTASMTFTPSRTNTPTNTTTPTNTRAPSGIGTYDERDVNIVYSGTWVAQAVTGNYANTEKYSTVIGSTAGFTFSGNQVTVRFRKASVFGNMEVWIDGGLKATVSQTNPTTIQNQNWTSPTLTSGTHTMVLRHATGTYIALDAIVISEVATLTPTLTFTSTSTFTPTMTFTHTSTFTPTFTPTFTSTTTPTNTLTPSETPSPSPTSTFTDTPTLTPTFTATATTPAIPEPYSYFSLDDKNDSQGFANTTQYGSVSYIPGLVGNALSIPTDMENTYIGLGSGTYKNFLYEDGTINVWVNARELNSHTSGAITIVTGSPHESSACSINHWILGYVGIPGNEHDNPVSPGNERIQFWAGSYGADTVHDPTNTVTLDALTGELSANQWYMISVTHVAATHQWNLYVDGELKSSVSSPGGIGPGAQSINCPYAIGGAPYSPTIYGRGFPGLIDELGFWNEALSSDQIQVLFTDNNPY